MAALVGFTTAQGGLVAVEITDDDPGYERISRRPQEVIAKATMSIETAFDEIKYAAQALVNSVKSMNVSPDEIEVEFGVRLNAEVGAVIARTEAEGHFQLTLRWSRSNGQQ